MNDIIPFTHETFGTVRSTIIDGEPWFVATDVCTSMGIANTASTLSLLDNDEKGLHTVDTLGGNQKMSIVNEPGLYTIILRSRKPEAKEFKRWITHDVIPSIRKNGIYATDEAIDKILDNPDFGIRLLQQLKDERQKNTALQETVNVQAKKIEEDAPKVTYYDLVLQTPGLLSTTDIAKEYGMSAYTLNKLLEDWGVQYKRKNTWYLYAKYQDKGYAKTTTEIFNGYARQWLKWFQKGRLFIYELMKAHGYLPICEQTAA